MVATVLQIENHFRDYKQLSQSFCVYHASYFFRCLGQIPEALSVASSEPQKTIGTGSQVHVEWSSHWHCNYSNESPARLPRVSLSIPLTNPVLTGGPVSFQKEIIFLKSELLQIQKRSHMRKNYACIHTRRNSGLSWKDSHWNRTFLRCLDLPSETLCCWRILDTSWEIVYYKPLPPSWSLSNLSKNSHGFVVRTSNTWL